VTFCASVFKDVVVGPRNSSSQKTGFVASIRPALSLGGEYHEIFHCREGPFLFHVSPYRSGRHGVDTPHKRFALEPSTIGARGLFPNLSDVFVNLRRRGRCNRRSTLHREGKSELNRRGSFFAGGFAGSQIEIGRGGRIGATMRKRSGFRLLRISKANPYWGRNVGLCVLRSTRSE